MSKYSNPAIALILALLLASCQGGAPEPAPQPKPSVTAAPQTPGETAAEAVAQAEAEPIDFNQQFYEQALDDLKNGEADEALVVLNQLAQDAPGKPRLFTNLGLAQFRLDQPELAEQAFIKALARDPDDAVAHNHLGILLRRKGQFQEALVHYQRAIDIDSEYARAHLNLGILFDLYLQDLEKALQQYRQYRSLTSEENAQVDGWIIDIERRLKSAAAQS